MKSVNMKTLLKYTVLLFDLLWSELAFTQVSTFYLGASEFKSSVGIKRSSLLVKAAVGKVSFHAGVGGISFEQVATPDNAIATSVINLKYDALKKDGDRLKISIGTGNDYSYSVYLPDWQLVPIAKYANDTNNAVFSIYNPSNLGTYRYHPAFDSTLLGLRMFQAECCQKRSEEHTSELQSLTNLVCRLLLEKKKLDDEPMCSFRQRLRER